MDKTGLEFFSNERGTDFAVGDHEILSWFSNLTKKLTNKVLKMVVSKAKIRMNIACHKNKTKISNKKIIIIANCQASK